MYAWLWRTLPGGLPGKIVGSLALLVGVLALLFFVVFPWAEAHAPWNDVTVGPAGGAPAATAPAAPGDSPAG